MPAPSLWEMQQPVVSRYPCVKAAWCCRWPELQPRRPLSARQTWSWWSQVQTHRARPSMTALVASTGLALKVWRPVSRDLRQCAMTIGSRGRVRSRSFSASRCVIGRTGKLVVKAARRVLFKLLNLVRRRPLLLLGAYMLTSIVAFGLLEGWHPADSVYFSVTTLTTVGYGDLTPDHPLSRLFASAYILIALLLLATGVGNFLQRFVAEELKTALQQKLKMQLHESAEVETVDIFDTNSRRRKRLKRFRKQLVLLGGFIVLSSIVVHYVLGLPRGIDALYFSVVTLTTVGLGDIVPKTAAAKCAIAALCLTGVPLFGNTLAQLVGFVYGEKLVHGSIYRVENGLTHHKLMRIQRLYETMYHRGLFPAVRSDTTAEHKVSPCEFCCFLLLRSGVISMTDMAMMLRNFRELDVAEDGYLWSHDVEGVPIRAHTNPRSNAKPRTMFAKAVCAAPWTSPAAPGSPEKLRPVSRMYCMRRADLYSS